MEASDRIRRRPLEMPDQPAPDFELPATGGKTFRLSNEPIGEPMRRLLIAAGERAGDVVCRSVGESWSSDT